MILYYGVVISQICIIFCLLFLNVLSNCCSQAAMSFICELYMSCWILYLHKQLDELNKFTLSYFITSTTARHTDDCAMIPVALHFGYSICIEQLSLWYVYCELRQTEQLSLCILRVAADWTAVIMICILRVAAYWTAVVMYIASCGRLNSCRYVYCELRQICTRNIRRS